MASRRDSEMRMVLLGKTGSGKSASGNTILRENTFRVNSTFQHITRECKRVYGPVNGRMAWLIDTPGLFDGVTPRNVLKAQLERAIDLAHPGVHVFLLVMRLDVRFTEEEKNTVKWIVENFGEEIQMHTIVLFTHGNVLRERSIEQYLDVNPELRRVVDSMAGYHVFENDNEADETQVPELLEKINMVMHNNGNQMYTKEMYREVQRNRLQSRFIEFRAAVLGPAAGAVAAAVRGGVAGIAGAAAGAAVRGGVVGLVGVAAAGVGAAAVGAGAAGAVVALAVWALMQ